MIFYEKEDFEESMEQIIEQLGYLLLDIVLMSFKKINSENQTLKQFFDARLQFDKEEEF
jgi:cupin superfamily acireductone dioxygenase involved in methionine salvage